MVAGTLTRAFPHLTEDGYEIKSKATPEYNCIAWAANENHRWWWPLPEGLYYWPPEALAEVTLDAFIQAFAMLGYTPCSNAELAPGREKIAIYIDGSGNPAHAARQLASGGWTSKLGSFVDINHSLAGLENSSYGVIGQILDRPR